jgi:hypothetical protein
MNRPIASTSVLSLHLGSSQCRSDSAELSCGSFAAVRRQLGRTIVSTGSFGKISTVVEWSSRQNLPQRFEIFWYNTSLRFRVLHQHLGIG